jgi:iron-sulfur cluster assembly protein
MTMNLVITDSAKEKLKSYQTDKDRFLRISVVTGGCSGMTYNAVIDTNSKEQDIVVFDDGEMKIVSDQRSALFLDGLHIDFSNDLIKSGFCLTNPNASESCACGSSFAV